MNAPTPHNAISPPLPWQAAAWQRFDEQIAQARLPHALLLVGPPHSGLSQLALALARRLLCEAPSAGLNCGACHACHLSASGNHGDFLWLSPEGTSRVIKIDQVRTAVAMAQQTASFGDNKVLVLEPADTMNVAAANALLKSLEEPSPGTYLILTCSQLHALPATIRSRCQLVKLPQPARADSLAWLQTLTGDAGRSEQLLDAAGGLPLLAAALFQDPDSDTLFALHRACTELLAGRAEPASTVAEFAASTAPAVLDSSIKALIARLRELDDRELRGGAGTAMLRLVDELGALRLAVEGGANPNMNLLAERIVGKVQQILGAAGQGDKINRARGRS